MKSKTFYFFFAIIAMAGSTQAQNWFKDGCTWHYTWEEPGAIGFERLTVNPSVTITNGMTCRTLHHYSEYNIYNVNTNAYDIPVLEEGDGEAVCEIGDSIFYRNSSGELWLQYDFSMQPGDTLQYSDLSSICTYTMVVDSLGSLDLQGTDLRTQHVTIWNLCSGNPWEVMRQYLIIERIGLVPLIDDNYHPSYLIPQLIFNDIQDGSTWWFRCFSNNDMDYHITDDCDYIILDTDESGIALSVKLNVYPNPAHDYLNITNRTGNAIRSAKIYAINGVMEMEMADLTSERIEIEGLQKGMHIVCLETKQGVFRQLLVKQ